MSFPKYPKYKDSGVEWLGEVPEHWNRTRIKHLARPGSKTFVDGDWIETPYITTEGVRLLQCGNIGTGVFEEQGFRYISEDSFNSFDCTEVEPNDVLICRLQSSRTILAGRACLAPQLGLKMITSVDNCILKPSSDFDARCIVYLLSTSAYLSFIEVVARGGTRDRISRSMLGDVELIAPPVDEQTAIAVFLDRETAKIDALIAEQQRLIELLQEKRQAVISHAVTKGLNPNAPMKDSGVQWLGEVPEHWGVTRISRYATVGNGSTPSRDNQDYWRDGDIPWLSSGEVNQLHVTEASEFVTAQAIKECSLTVLSTGTVLVGMVGQGKTRGLSALLRIEAAINQNLAGIVTTSCLKPEYLHFVFQAMYEYLREYGRGGNQAALNCEILSAAIIPLPPYNEQEAICVHLANACDQQDSLLTATHRTISLLHERRSALISAAVTGQIDVRGLAGSEAA